MSVVSRLAITFVRIPTDTPDTCWNKLPLPSTQIERPFTKIESASISSEADSVSVDAASNFVESASGGSAFDVVFVEFNAGGATSNSVGRTSNVFSKNAKLFLCARRMRSHKLFFFGSFACQPRSQLSRMGYGSGLWMFVRAHLPKNAKKFAFS